MSTNLTAVLQQLLQNTSNLKVLQQLMTPDAIYVSLNFDNPELKKIEPWAGTHKGPQALSDVFAAIQRFWKTLDFEATDTIEQGSRVALFGSFTYKSNVTGKEITSPFSLLARFEGDKVAYLQFLHFTKRIVRPDGAIRHICCVGVPVTQEGTFQGFLGTGMDVTQQEQLRQLEADLAHINRVSTLGEMAASLAHEIKQPIAATITSANSCIEWLAHEPPDLDRARAAAARIDKYGKRAIEIIDRIRSFYRKSPPQHELVDLNGTIQEMLALLKGEADRYSVAMRTELSAELPKIIADRVQLQQVFMNLMLNSIEAMKDSGGELKVNSELQDSQVQFSISDTGVGLPAEKLDQIFSAFFTTKPQGSGMGLAISRSIVESHGGRLWAAANGGRGATFHFTLPTAAEILQVPATGT